MRTLLPIGVTENDDGEKVSDALAQFLLSISRSNPKDADIFAGIWAVGIIAALDKYYVRGFGVDDVCERIGQIGKGAEL